MYKVCGNWICSVLRTHYGDAIATYSYLLQRHEDHAKLFLELQEKTVDTNCRKGNCKQILGTICKMTVVKHWNKLWREAGTCVWVKNDKTFSSEIFT